MEAAVCWGKFWVCDSDVNQKFILYKIIVNLHQEFVVTQFLKMGTIFAGMFSF